MCTILAKEQTFENNLAALFTQSLPNKVRVLSFGLLLHLTLRRENFPERERSLC